MDKRDLEWGHEDLMLASDIMNKWWSDDDYTTAQAVADIVALVKPAPPVGESSPGGEGVWCCEKKSKCKWQCFALHHGLAWGVVPESSPWREWHERECGGRLIQIVPRGAALSPSKARVGEDGGDATPGMDLEALEASVRENHFLNEPKALDLIAILRKAPPKGDPADPSLLAGGRECWVMWYKGNPVGVSQSNPGSARGWVEWKRMHEVSAPPPQAGAQGDATGGGA